jgi:hypothetical protein
MKPLLDRLRNDGASWAQSLFSEAADRIAELEAENARLLDVVQMQPHTAYLEAVQRACDERMVALKHTAREAWARAEEAERQLADLRAQHESDKQRGHKYRDKLVSQLAEARAALEPFTKFDCEDFPDDMLLFEDTPNLTIGDIRRASAALQDRAPAEGEAAGSIPASSTTLP